MSLQFRRGEELQRTGIIPAAGEPIWVTGTKKLYIGDGVSLGGVNILATSAGTGLAWDPATQTIRFSGLGTGIINVQADTNPTLGGNLILNSRNITGTGNISISGTVTATQFIGTRVSADTSPSLGGNLNLNNRNITGTGDISISGNFTTNTNIQTNTLAVVQNATVGGTLNVTGAVATGNLTTGDLTNGSLTISSSSLLSNASPIFGDNILSNNTVNIGSPATPNTMWVYSARNFAILNGITTGPQTSGIISRISRGTLSVKTAVQPGDATLYLEAYGHDGTNYIQTGAMVFFADITGTVSTGSIPGQFGVVIPDSSVAGFTALSFNRAGVLTAPIMQLGSFTTTERTALTPVVGMMIYNTTLNKFQGYQNTGGTTLQWVDLS